MKTLTQKRKGFTLIELIIVIAILAILMAIAIPQFARYTQSANQSNDDNLAALLVKSTQLLMAEGKIVPNSSGTISVTKSVSTGSLNYTTSSFSVTNLQTQMESLVGTDAKLKYYTSLSINITRTVGVDGGYIYTVTSTATR